MSKLKTNTIRHVDGSNDNITLDSSQNVTVEADLTIPDKIIHSGDTNTTIRFPAADTVSVETGGSERVRVDSSGRLLIGVTASTPTDNDANNVALQVEGTSGDTSRAMLRTNTTTAGDGSFLYFARSRGTSLGSKTSVSDDDSIGGLIFNGADGSDDTRAAGIQAFCDGTPGTDDMPGRLSFFTTPDGSGNYSERLRIASNGKVGIGVTNPRTRLDVGNGQLSFDHRTDYSIRFYNGAGNNWSAINNPITSDGTSNSELKLNVAQGTALHLHTDGAVTKPKSPAFAVHGPNAWQTVTHSSSAVTMQFDTEFYDAGANYNTSTYRFTAPVDGAYQFHLSVYFKMADSSDASSYATLRWNKNGSSDNQGYRLVMYGNHGKDDNNHCDMMAFALSANDYVTVTLEAEDQDVKYYPGHSVFSGSLIG